MHRNEIRTGALRTAVVGLAMLGLGACGSVANFEKPISDFQTATTDAQSALQTASDTLTENKKNQLLADLTTDKQGLRRKAETEGCQSTSKSCVVVLVKLSDESDKEPFPPAPVLENSLELMGQIVLYGENLFAIVKAATADQIETKTNEALASLAATADTVKGINGVSENVAGALTTIQAYAAPAEQLIDFLVDTNIERTKLSALRHATKTTDELDPTQIIKDAAVIFADEAVLALTPEKSRLVAAQVDAEDAYQLASVSEKPALLTAMVQSSEALDKALKAPAQTTFNAMADAHTKMVEAIQGGEATLPEAIAAMNSFVAKVKELKSIYDSFKAVEASN